MVINVVCTTPTTPLETQRSRQVHASTASPTTSPLHAAPACPAAVPEKEFDLFLYFVGLTFTCEPVSHNAPKSVVKEPRCLSPISLVGSESGLESHPYWTVREYSFRSCFASEIIAFSGDAIFHPRNQLPGFQIASDYKLKRVGDDTLAPFSRQRLIAAEIGEMGKDSVWKRLS